MQRGNTEAVTDRSSDGISLTQLRHYMGTVLGPANVPSVAAGKKKKENKKKEAASNMV